MKNLDKSWVPTVTCEDCRRTLQNWHTIQKEVVIIPTAWCEPINHESDCYFCRCDVNGFNHSNKVSIDYPKVRSVTPAQYEKIKRDRKAVSQSLMLQPPEPEQENDIHGSEENVFSDDDKPDLFDQNALDDLIRDLNLTKDSSELLASRLKERHLL